MSIFSEQLNAIILKKRLSLPELAESSGLTTALISKIKTGKRLPESEEKISSLIQALHCTQKQQAELLDEYRIEKIGRDKYLCMKECSQCLEALTHFPCCQLFEQKLTNLSPTTKQCIVGEVNIAALFQYILNYEIREAKGFLRISIQPNHHLGDGYLLNMLSITSAQKIEIEQLIPLRDSDSFNNKDNMLFSRYCLHFASLYGDKYHPYYYYKEDFASDFFPFCVLTTHHALLISKDYQTALFFGETSTLTALHHMFDTVRKQCYPFFHMDNSPRSYIECYKHAFAQLNGASLETLQLSYEPSILGIIPSRIAAKHIHPTLSDSYIQNFLTSYWQKVEYAHIKTIFSLDGLDLFMQTGICYELPYESQSAFTLSERRLILRIFLEKCASKQVLPILLKKGSLKLAPELSLKVLNKQSVLFIWSPAHTSFSSCILDEITIKKNFSYFLEYIQTTPEYTYSPEESLNLLYEYVQKYLEQPT